jgi:hypothetical protein
MERHGGMERHGYIQKIRRNDVSRVGTDACSSIHVNIATAVTRAGQSAVPLQRHEAARDDLLWWEVDQHSMSSMLSEAFAWPSISNMALLPQEDD